jgi:peroxiredoxin
MYRKIFLTLMLPCLAILGFSFQRTTSLSIGDTLPMGEVKLKDVSGKMMTLQQLKKNNGLLVVFTCNTCPYVVATQERYRLISKLAKANEIGLVTINSNEAQRGDVDSFEEMKLYASQQEYDFPYLLDLNATLADAFGATKTPDVFLFNSKLTLVYKGAIDDSHRDATQIKQRFLEKAMQNMVRGESIDPSTTAAVGCSIKRIKP